MLDIDVSFDFKEVEQMLKKLPDVAEKATARSLNRTRDQVAAVARRMIAKDMGIPQKRVKEGMFQIKATRNKLLAGVIARGRPINLIRFGARKTRKGVSAKAWGKRKVYKGTFIGNQGRTVFKRMGKARTPIRGVWGPSIPQTMLMEYIEKAMREVANDRFPINFAQDMNYFLSKQRL